MYSKRASTVCQKMVLKKPDLIVKKLKICLFGPYDFVQISPACGPNVYQQMYGETLDLQRQH